MVQLAPAGSLYNYTIILCTKLALLTAIENQIAFNYWSNLF